MPQNNLFSILKTISLINTIHSRISDSEILIMSNIKFKDILSFFNENISIYYSDNKNDFFKKWAIISQINKLNIDHIIDFNPGFNILYSLFLKHKNYYKIKNNKNLNTQLKECLNIFDINLQPIPPKWIFPEDFRFTVGKIKAPLLTICPFDDNNFFPLEKYLYIASIFNKKFGGNIIILGDGKYKNISQAFEVYDYIINLTGKTSFHQEAFVLKYSTLILTEANNLAYISNLTNNKALILKHSKNDFEPFYHHNLIITQEPTVLITEETILKELEDLMKE